jgi:hypothetical protein
MIPELSVPVRGLAYTAPKEELEKAVLSLEGLVNLVEPGSASADSVHTRRHSPKER